MTVYTTLQDVPAGWRGDITRTMNLLLVPANFKLGENVQVGRAVCFNADGMAEYYTGGEGQTMAGLTVRTSPAGSGYPEGTDIPEGRTISIMQRGFALVKCVAGEPKQGGKVYMYKADNADKKQGDFAAAEESGQTVEIVGATWGFSGVQNGLCEIAII